MKLLTIRALALNNTGVLLFSSICSFSSFFSLQPLDDLQFWAALNRGQCPVFLLQPFIRHVVVMMNACSTTTGRLRLSSFVSVWKHKCTCALFSLRLNTLPRKGLFQRPLGVNGNGVKKWTYKKKRIEIIK